MAPMPVVLDAFQPAAALQPCTDTREP
jgi:hypothetical protein